MSKKIKFDLICDDYSIHTIEDLQEHFSIQEILDYFRNGLLLRWLEVRGYQEEYNAVRAIQETDDTEILKKLVSIFQIDATEEEITDAMELFHYRENRENELKNYQMGVHAEGEIIRHAVKEYQKQIEEFEHFDGTEEDLKKKIRAFGDEYESFIALTYGQLILKFVSEKNWNIVLHLFTVPTIRKYYLGKMGKQDAAITESMKGVLKSELLNTSAIKVLDNIPGVYKKRGPGTGRMTEIVPPGQKVMIIYLPDGAIQITKDDGKTEYVHTWQCNGQFPISDGFKASCAAYNYNNIYWMEV